MHSIVVGRSTVCARSGVEWRGLERRFLLFCNVSWELRAGLLSRVGSFEGAEACGDR